LENAVRICDATFGNIYRWDGEALTLAAAHQNTPPAIAEERRLIDHGPQFDQPFGSHGGHENRDTRRRPVCG